MRRIFLLLASLFLSSLTISAQRAISVEDIWKEGKFNAKGIPGFNFQNDGVHYTRLAGTAIEQCDLRTGEKSATLFDAASVKTDAVGWEGKFDGYEFSADESKLLLTTGTEQIYRHSTKADFYVFDPKKNSLTKLYDGGKQRYATFSPDNSKVAFEYVNCLFIKDLATGETKQLMKDGMPNRIINGASDWVYEEEFVLVKAFQWSPDGQRLAYLRFDERAVPEMVMDKYTGGAYPDSVKFKYPKVGQKNAVVTAWIHDLATGKNLKINTDCYREAAGEDDYLPRIAWTPAGQLCITWMNRHQNDLKLLLADPTTGECSTLYEEKNKYYLDLQDVTFLKNGSGFVLPSEKSGFNHLYLYDMAGQEICPLTKGDWDVTEFYGIDETNGLAYFQAASKNAMNREVFSVKLDGKGMKKVAAEKGTNSAHFSKTFDYFVRTFSGINTPPQYAVCDRKGKVVRMLEDNAGVGILQKEFGAIPVEFFDFKTSENVELNGWMIRPTAPQFKGKKLPTLMFVYGGPGSQQVVNQWKGNNYWWFEMLAQQGYNVACVDNRGTGGRGEEFKKMTYLNLGKLEVQDQLEAAKYLGKQSYVDPERIGIFGWSYGGFMSTNCILKGQQTFKAAIAVAPVTNWKWYDSIYTERYMQTEAENPQGYKENSPVNYADMLNGNFLLVHGTADDNVHFQHTAELADQLIAANKQFDTMIYPNRAHGITGGNARAHLYNLMTNFLNEKLKGKVGEVVRP